MTVRSLQVLHLGTDAEVDKGLFTFNVDRGKTISGVFLGYLIRTNDGNILIDTGPHPDDADMMNSMGNKIIVRLEDQLPQRLREAGSSLEKVDLVIITHLHWDHVGWLTELRNADVIVQKEEYSFALDPAPYASGGYFTKRYSSSKIKWKTIDGDHVLMPGVTLLYTPGHTIGHQSVMVDLPNFGPILLSGDAGFLRENFEKELIPSFVHDPKQALLSIRRLNTWSHVRKAPIFPAHDIDHWRENTIKSPEAYS